MFQNFEVTLSQEAAAGRISLLRDRMGDAGIDVYLVPHSDEHQSEYLPASAERLAWLTGFTGSAGFSIVTSDSAILFVDGRYTLQAGKQVDSAIFTIQSLVDMPPSKWIENNASKSVRIGFDPRLVTIAQKRDFERAATKVNAVLTPCANLVDLIWEDRPPAPAGPVTVQDVSFAGVEASQKIAELRREISNAGADMALISDLASIAWTFNIRGTDIAHTPLAIGFALLPVEGEPQLFMDNAKLDDETAAHLQQIGRLQPPELLETVLAECAKRRKVLCDEHKTSSHLAEVITGSGGEIVIGRDPVTLPRAIKNDTELAGARSAHLRDGVAVTSFLAWLDRQPPGSADEISAAIALENFRADTARRMNSELLEISFDTISGAGANGAIVHYRVNMKSNVPLQPDSLYLVDSGGQYRDGTTDITRTVPIGTPPDGAVEDFTLVLKGHIAIATARFPDGTRGVDLDVLARIALWRNGRDYAHGTGHGVGSFLSVHEGPQSISKRGMEPLLPGMILSNEPGMYRDGKYGIRIENLVVVQPAQDFDNGNVPVHGFETLTLVPIDLRLVDRNLLNREETAWLNAYHKRVREMLSPWLDNTDQEWLVNATTPL